MHAMHAPTEGAEGGAAHALAHTHTHAHTKYTRTHAGWANHTYPISPTHGRKRTLADARAHAAHAATYHDGVDGVEQR